MRDTLPTVLDSLPGSLGPLVESALKAREPFERAAKVSLAAEVLTRWLVAVRLAGTPPTDWPSDIRRWFAADGEDRSPGFGTWLRWAEKSGAFVHDGAAWRALSNARVYRNRWAHHYDARDANSEIRGVGLEPWWQRLVSGDACAPLRHGSVVKSAKGSSYPGWLDQGGVTHTLEPWVVFEDDAPLILHEVLSSSRRGAYANYLGARTDYPLEARFVGGMTAPGSVHRFRLQTRSGNRAAHFIGDPRQGRFLILVGDVSGGLPYLLEYARGRGLRAMHIADADDLQALVDLKLDRLQRALVGTSTSDVAREVRERLSNGADAARLIRLEPPSELEVLAAAGQSLRRAPRDAREAQRVLDLVRGDATRLVGVLAALEKLGAGRPFGAAEAKIVEQSLAFAEHGTSGSFTSADAVDFETVPLAEVALALDRLLLTSADAIPTSAEHVRRLTGNVRDLGRELVSALPSGEVGLHVAAWLRRWLDGHDAAIAFASQALVALENGLPVEAVSWLQEIRPVVEVSTSRLAPIASAFVAAVLDRLGRHVDPNTRRAVLRMLTLESLCWLRARHESGVDDIAEAALMELDRGRRHQRHGLLNYLLTGEGGSGPYDAELRCLDDHAAGAAAGLVTRGAETWRKSIQHWFQCFAWVSPDDAMPKGMGFPTSYDHPSAPTRLASLYPRDVADPAQVDLKGITKRAIQGVATHGLETEEGRSWLRTSEVLMRELAPYWHMSSLRDLVRVLADQGEMDSAWRYVRRMDSGRNRVSALCDLAERADAAQDVRTAFRQAIAIAAEIDVPRIRREKAIVLLASLLRSGHAQDDDLAEATAFLSDHGAAADIARGWDWMTLGAPTWNEARSAPAPEPSRTRAAFLSALHPGLLASARLDASRQIPELRRTGGRMIELEQPMDVRLSDGEWGLLQSGLAIEARVTPHQLADFAGILSAETASDSARHFSLRLGGKSPAFAVETLWGMQHVSVDVRLERLSDEQQSYTILAVYDGRRMAVFVDGVVVGAEPAGGRLVLRGGALRLGEQAKGFRPFVGRIHEVRLWGLEASTRWTPIFEAVAP